MNENFLKRVYETVESIPRGRVASYGQVARIAGFPGRARQVGAALAKLPDRSSVPWHRVVGASGTVSERGDEGSEFLQRRRLELEGIRFSSTGRFSMTRFQWKKGRDPAAESFRRSSGMRASKSV